MDKLKYGDNVWVSGNSEEHAKLSKCERIFVAYNPVNNRPVCAYPDTGNTGTFAIAIKIPTPKLVPWTFDTAPKQIGFMVRHKKQREQDEPVRLAEVRYTHGLVLSGAGTRSYETLKERWEWSTDGETWNPCGVMENE